MPCPEKFKESLAAFNVDGEIISEITEGYEKLASKSQKAKKAAFFKRAVDIMDQKLESSKVRDILEWNACCKTGARQKKSKEFARINEGLPLEDKLAKIAKAQYMNMGTPVLEENDILLIYAVSYVKDEKYACGCSNFRNLKRDYPVSSHYCYCCGGHFKYHYEIMLGIKLELLEVVSSPLDTDGKEPCKFCYKIRNLMIKTMQRK